MQKATCTSCYTEKVFFSFACNDFGEFGFSNFGSENFFTGKKCDSDHTGSYTIFSPSLATHWNIFLVVI